MSKKPDKEEIARAGLEVRRILTRHWIDLTKLNLLCRAGHVTLTGKLQKLYMKGMPREDKEPDYQQLLDQILKEIASVPGVRRIRCELENVSPRA